MAFYRLVKVLEYETANPDDDHTAAAKAAEMRRHDTNGTAHTTGTLSSGGDIPMDPLGALPDDVQLSQRLPSSRGEKTTVDDPAERAARQV